MAMMGKAYVFANPEMFTPSVAQCVGVDRRNPMGAFADPRKGESPAAPINYTGTFPVMSEDKDVLMWATPCDLMAQGAQSRPW